MLYTNGWKCYQPTLNGARRNKQCSYFQMNFKLFLHYVFSENTKLYFYKLSERSRFCGLKFATNSRNFRSRRELRVVFCYFNTFFE